MRIGMILDKIFPPDPRVENEASALIAMGHEVFLFCLKYDGSFESTIFDQMKVMHYVSNKLEYKLSALAYTFPFYSIIMSKKIAHFLDQNKIEIIHIHDMVIAKAVFKANIKKGLPVVLDLHENRPEIMKLYPHLQKFPGKALISPNKWKRMEEKFIKKANRTIVVTAEAKEQILSRVVIDKDKIVVVPNTVKKHFYAKAKFNKDILIRYRDKFVILYIGDTGLRRGLQTAIDALKELKPQARGADNYKSEFKLVIVGENSSDGLLKKQVKELGLVKDVDFEGWQDPKLFASYIKAASICISPLLRNIHHDTTYANKLFQYMSFAKPLLVSDATAQENLVLRAKSGLVHEEKNAKDFAKKVLKLYNDPVKQKKLGENGKRFIENEFRWEKVSGDLVGIYNNLETNK